MENSVLQWDLRLHFDEKHTAFGAGVEYVRFTGGEGLNPLKLLTLVVFLRSQWKARASLPLLAARRPISCGPCIQQSSKLQIKTEIG